MVKRNLLRNMILSGIFAALIAIGAFIKVPVPMLPFTLQVAMVNLAALMLGGIWGSVACIAYMVIGLIGVPIFTNGGGIMYVLQPSFGYIIGFCVGSFVSGWIARKSNKPTYLRLAAASAINIVIIYIIGMTYLSLICAFYLNSPIGFGVLLVNFGLLFLPGDLATCAISVIVAKKVIPIVFKTPTKTPEPTSLNEKP